MTKEIEIHTKADRVARESYGRLVAFLSARSRNVAAAEVALADAFRLALENWPRDGIPKSPEARLLTVVRRQLSKSARHARVIAGAEPELLLSIAVPDDTDLTGRLEAVLQAIYAAYGAGCDAIGGGDLAGEALWLGRTLLVLMPEEPEDMGLLALMFYCESRKQARRPGDDYVPLDEQDIVLWNADIADKADRLLSHAGLKSRFGRFRCEAAIQSLHAARSLTRNVDRGALETLYAALIGFAPTVDARRPIATARTGERGSSCCRAWHKLDGQPVLP